MTKQILLAAMISTSLNLFADAAPNCTPTRMATAVVSLRRIFWEQDAATQQWAQKSEEVCTTGQVEVPVYEGVEGAALNCATQLLARCPMELDGTSHLVRVHSILFLYHRPDGVISKQFIANYNSDRGTGENGFSVAETEDLTLKKIALTLGDTRVTPPAGANAHLDAYTARILFEDSNAH